MSDHILTQKKKTVDMTQGSIAKAIIAFTVPMIFGNLLQQLYNIVDTLIVGRFLGDEGDAAIAAIGASMSPMMLMLALFIGIGGGATILISQFFGANDIEGIKKTIATANSFLLIAFIPMSILGYVCTPFFLGFMNLAKSVLPHAIEYLRIMFIGTITMLGYNMNAGILRGMGDSKAPLIFLVISTIINITLDLIFVAGFGMGVRGAGIATVVAQGVSWIVSIIYFKNKYGWLEVKFHKISITGYLMKSMIKLGFPLALNNALFALGFLILQSLVYAQGETFSAGTTLAGRVDNLVFLPIQSFGTAATTFAGQNLGARKYDRIDRGFWTILAITLAVYFVMALAIFLFAPSIVGLFTDTPETIAVAVQCIYWIVPFYWIFIVYSTCNSFLNGVGRVTIPTVASFTMLWLARLPASRILFHFLGSSFIYGSFPVSWIIGLLISGGYFMSGVWRKKLPPIDIADDDKKTELIETPA